MSGHWHDDEAGLSCSVCTERIDRHLREIEATEAGDVCACGHELHRHDMGHGCIECRCRRYQEATA